jgi:hypothetical protein
MDCHGLRKLALAKTDGAGKTFSVFARESATEAIQKEQKHRLPRVSEDEIHRKDRVRGHESASS